MIMGLNNMLLMFIIVILSSSTFIQARTLENSPRHCVWSPDEEALHCKIRTAASASSLIAEIATSRWSRVSSLWLYCTDIMSFETSLDLGGTHLSRLTSLKEIRLDQCKIRYVAASALAGLPSLRSVSLRTHNTDWSAMSMEFHKDSFRGLSSLRSLDLGDNNVWSLPSEVFCSLHGLKELNLTENRLQDVSQMGFSDWGQGPIAPGKSCNTALEILDMSSNDIASLPDNGFSSLRSLRNLFLQNNAIASVGDRAFVGLNGLQLLNLSSNNLAALPPEMFQSSREIKQIYLNNNSISVLAPGLLEGLDQLQILDMSHNDLTSEWVNRDTFSGLIRLVVLNLSHNKITKIDSLLFQDLYNLQFLSLENNRIARISEGAFSSLKNIHSLSLAQNQLTRIDGYLFSNLYVLSQLFLDGNQIEEIEHRSFENITKLQDLGLSGNLLKRVPPAVKSLRFLKSLDVGMNHISYINGSDFEGLDGLFGLRLVDNQIEEIAKDSFMSLPSLQILNIASNKIKRIDHNAFGSNPSVRAVRLDSNQLTDITGIFTNMNNLGWLNISDNNITVFDYSQTPVSLEWLDMHNNFIEKIIPTSNDNINIKMLDVSFNSLTSIDETILPNSLEVIFLNNNNIANIKSGTFLAKHSLEKVVLYGNKLQTIDVGAFAISTMNEDKQLPEFYISDNPFICDCTMEWLQKINHIGMMRQNPKVMDLDMVTCSLAHSRGKTKELLLELKPSQFLCPYESHCFALCHCCDFDACDCKMTCPDKCSCYHDMTWNTNVVDCSNADLKMVPERIPMDATEIYLDGNDLRHLGNHVFIGKKKLQILFLNNSNIESINYRTFTGIDTLKDLHLENNHLKTLTGVEFGKLNNLESLNLANNNIKMINTTTFNTLSSLKKLNLNHNGIINSAPWQVFESASTDTKISLSGNKWSCNCEGITELQKWITDHPKESESIICEGEIERNLVDTYAHCTSLMGETTTKTITQNHLFLDSSKIIENYIPHAALILIAAIILLLLCALMFTFREEFRLWLHSKYQIRICSCLSPNEDEQKRKHYDAYVVYSIRDEDVVNRAFVNELENSGRTLCLHYRDVRPPDRRGDTGVIYAVENSERLVIVLSITFLQNEWCRNDFRSALLSGVNSVDASRRRERIIFIVTTDLSAIDLDPDLKALLKTCSVIVWGEKNCREKLNFRLPDVRSIPPDRTIPNVHKFKSDNINKINSRYTASPTCHEAWYKYATPSPTQSTYVSGLVSEEDQVSETSAALDHSYATIDTREQHPLRSSLVPCVTCTHTPNRKTYFV